MNHEFFSHFLHDKDGIHAVAKETGRQQFLNFGEVFETSKPMENSGEKKVAAYLGSADAPELDSVISFPLHLDLKKVFAGGRPPAELQYRLLQHMQMYRDPYLTPTFVDNHDMSRFLDSGDTDGLKQALTTIFTIPGIPVIYQGTGQAMHETRQAMFAGGYGADKDYFDQQHEMYRFIRTLTQLRTSERIFTRGTMHVIGADATGPGLLAYVREHEGSRVLVMFNTANHPILVSDLDVGVKTPSALKSLMGEQNITSLSSSGRLTKILPARAIEVAEIVESKGFQSNDAGNTPIILLPESVSQPLSGDVVLTGQANPGEALLLVKNGNLETARPISVDYSGKLQVSYNIRNLGREQFSLQIYSPERNLASNRLSLESLVDSAEYGLRVDDPANDDYGLNGYTLPPLHKQSIGQMDILAADIEVAGEVLQLTLTMRELSDDWLPLNGFDNVALSIFIDNPDRQGLTDLPKLSAVMPDDWRWDVGHVVYGWGNTAFDSSEASADQFGRRLGVAPHVVADASQKKIVITYRRTDLNISDWDGVNLYITTWDITGEGAYREISREPGEWEFGNSQGNTSKILDSLKAEIRFAE